MVETIRAVGVERVTLGTDFGQKINPHPAAGLQTYADALFAEGLTEAEIRRMACTNPCRAARASTRGAPVPRIDIPDGKADPEVRMWALRPEMGMGAGTLSHAVYEQSIVPVRERELARMRIAQINDCAICQQWRKTAGAAEAHHRGRLRERRRLARPTPATPSGSGSRSSTPSGSRSTTTRSTTTSSPACAPPYTDAEILDLTVCIGGVARTRPHAARARHRRAPAGSPDRNPCESAASRSVRARG